MAGDTITKKQRQWVICTRRGEPLLFTLEGSAKRAWNIAGRAWNMGRYQMMGQGLKAVRCTLTWEWPAPAKPIPVLDNSYVTPHPEAQGLRKLIVSRDLP
jgi:hypothetical protein